MHSDPKARRSRKACQTALKSSAAFALTLSAIGTTAGAQDILDPDVLPFQVLRNEIPPVDYTFGDGVDDVLTVIYDKAHRDAAFGNGRYARNLFEQAINRQALRLSAGSVSGLGHDELATLTSNDFASAATLL